MKPKNLNDVKISEAYYKTQQIETFIGLGEKGSAFDKKGRMVGERRKLVVLHQNGDDKEALIAQLETLIHGVKTDFEAFAS
jgi:hypothetical protein